MYKRQIQKAYNYYLSVVDQVNSVTSHSDSIDCGGCTCSGTAEAPACCYVPNWISINVYDWQGFSHGSGATLASTYAGSSSDGCSSSAVYPNQSDINNAYAQYEAIKNNAVGDYNSMLTCYTWSESNVYDLNPIISISYDDGTYSYSNQMKTNTNYNIDIDNSCTDTTVKVLTGCSGDSCTIETKNIRNCKYNNETREGISTFSFEPSGVFQYVLKSNNQSIHSYELSNYNKNDFTTNYIDIGYNNFPVAYKTVGTHDTLSLTYSYLGHIKYGSTAVDSILSSSDVDPSDNYNNWKCEFSVVSKLITGDTPNDPNGGINLIYRPIDLDNPFPDMDGSGRNTGSNWCYSGNCNNTNQNVSSYITNNRGVATDEIYQPYPYQPYPYQPYPYPYYR